MGALLHGRCLGSGHGHSHGLGGHGHSHSHGGESSASQNINVRAASIHILGDLIQSVGVLVAALIIKFKVRQRARRAYQGTCYCSGIYRETHPAGPAFVTQFRL